MNIFFRPNMAVMSTRFSSTNQYQNTVINQYFVTFQHFENYIQEALKNEGWRWFKKCCHYDAMCMKSDTQVAPFQIKEKTN